MRPPPPDARARNRAYLATAVVVAVAVLIVGGYLIFARPSSRSPSSVVLSYFRALARGDAKTALALGFAPPDKLLLTSTVLHQQQVRAPISAIRVVGTDSGAYGAVVHVRYRVGDQAVDNHINLVRGGGGGWRLASVAVDVLLSGISFVPSPTTFGLPLGTREEVYAFPGAVIFGSNEENFAITPESGVFTDPNMVSMATPHAVLSSVGASAVSRLMRAAMSGCAQSHELTPPQCPQHTTAPRDAGLVANSYGWRAPVSYAGVSYIVDDRALMRVQVTGQLTWTLTYRVRPAGATKAVTRSTLVNSPVNATIDLGLRPTAVHVD